MRLNPWMVALAMIGTPRAAPAVDSLPAFVVVIEYEGDRGGGSRGQGTLDREAAAEVLFEALRERGARAFAYAPDSTLPGVDAHGTAFAACLSASAGAGSPCVRVTVRLNHVRAGGRQTITATLRAVLLPDGRVLHTASGRAGPYAMDVPLQRLAERALENEATDFADGILAALTEGSREAGADLSRLRRRVSPGSAWSALVTSLGRPERPEKHVSAAVLSSRRAASGMRSSLR